MSNYVGKFFNAVSSALEFNSATLSGAIDIIVVEDEKGHRRCSPFHVRFGKLQILKSRGIPVNVYINGKKTDLNLRLGAAGEAYFKVPVENISPRAKTSQTGSHDQNEPSFAPEDDTPESDESTKSEDHLPTLPQDYMSDTEVEISRTARAGQTEVIERPRSPPPSTRSRKWPLDVARSRPTSHSEESGRNGAAAPAEAYGSGRTDDKKYSEEAPDSNFLLFAKDPEDTRTQVVPSDSSKSTESEAEDDAGNSVASGAMERSHSTQSSGRNESEKDDKDTEQVFSDILSRAMENAQRENGQGEKNGLSNGLMEISEEGAHSKDQSASEQMQRGRGIIENDAEKNLTNYEGEVFAMSLCGDLIDDSMSDEEIANVFEAQRVSYEQFALYPNMLYNSNMMFRVDGKLLDIRLVAPLVISKLAFGRAPTIDALSSVMRKPFVGKAEKQKPKRKSQRTTLRGFSWFGFRSSVPAETEGTPLIDDEELRAFELEPSAFEGSLAEYQTDVNKDVDSNAAQKPPQSITEATLAAGEPQIKVAEESTAEAEVPEDTDYNFGDVESEYLSLKPTSRQLMELELSAGVNNVLFQVANSNIEVECNMYVWKSDTKMVISDVDGTITRSDVLGQILPRVGRDWSQAGVAGLYTHIARHGYSFMYLTSRPIGQAAGTRAFLKSFSQAGGFQLPDGPIIMSPDRLMESFTREVIRRQPQEFKIAALREIRSLFAEDHNVFHAGFGNRDTDVISYRANGIPPYRIFTVNPQGELVVMKALYESAGSYTNLKTLVASVFPDISGKHGKEARRNLLEASEYNDWNYWKSELPE